MWEKIKLVLKKINEVCPLWLKSFAVGCLIGFIAGKVL